MPEPTQLFLSYARDDDEPFVKLLYEELTARGWIVWWDRQAMPSRGLKFTQEIRDAIDRSDRLLLVIGPSAVRSDYVRSEWEHALLFAKGVVPVLRLGDYPLVPQELSKLHCPDVRAPCPWEEAREELLRILAEPVPPLGPFLTAVPALPPHFLARCEELGRLQASVLADLERPVVITSARQITAVHGMGGLGKSVLAAAFCRLADTRRAFTDGIAWLGMGRQPDLLASIRLLGLAFGDEATNYADPATAQARLPRVLEHKVCLIVLDDVWERPHVAPFQNALGARCRLLLTTRDAALVTALDAGTEPLGLLSDAQSLALLTEWSGQLADRLPAEAAAVARECGHLPLALALSGAQVRDGTPWADIRDALAAAELDFLEHPHGSVMKSLKVSVEALPPDSAARYAELVVFPAAETIAEAAAITLWKRTAGLAERHARKQLAGLKSRALVREAPARAFSLHDLQHDYLRATAANLPALHAKLLDAYTGAALPDDGYIHNHLVWHLEQAGRIDQLHALFSEETAEGRNSWSEIRERLGQIAGYRKDLARVWELAEEAAAAGLEVRYALMAASLGSRARGIPPKLLGRLVEAGLWTVSQALDYAQQAGPEARFAALAELGRFLTEPQWREAVKVAWGTPEAFYQALGVAALGPHLPQPVLRELIEAILGHAGSLRQWPDSQLNRLFPAGSFAFQWMPNVLAEWIAISLSASLPEPQRTERIAGLLTKVRGTPESLTELYVLAAAVPFVSEPERSRWLGEVLSSLAPGNRLALYASAREMLHRMLEAPWMNQMIQAQMDMEKAMWGAVTDEAMRLSPEQMRQKMISSSELARYERSTVSEAAYEVLQRIAPACPAALLPQALETAWEIEDNEPRFLALACLMPHLGDALRQATLERAWKSAQGLESLAKLAPWATAAQCAQLVELLRQKGAGWNGATALAALAGSVPASLLPQIETLADSFASDADRLPIWVALLPRVDEPGRLRLLPRILQTLPSSNWRINPVFGQLAPYLSGAELEAGLETAAALEDDGSRAEWLDQLAPHLTAALLPRALAQAAGMLDTEAQSEALFALVPRMLEAGEWTEALAAARAIPDDWMRSAALVSLAARDQGEVLLGEALAAARRVRPGWYRRRGSRFAESVGTALSNAARLYDEPERRQLLCESIQASPPDPVQASLSLHIAECGYPVWALEVATVIADSVWRGTALVWIAPHLDETLLGRALDVCAAIRWEEDRVSTLAGLSPFLPEPFLNQALRIAHELGSNAFRLTALTALIPRLAEPRRDDVIEWAMRRAGTMKPLRARVRAFAALSGFLEPPRRTALLGAALRICRTMKDDGERAGAVTDLAVALDSALLEAACSLARQSADAHWRDVMLSALAVRLADSGAPEQALGELPRIGDESYRAYALQQIAAHLNRDELLERALAIAADLGSGHLGRADSFFFAGASSGTKGVGWSARAVMGGFARRLPPRLHSTLHRQFTELLHDLASGKRPDLFWNLSVLPEVVETLGGAEALRETSRAMRAVIRWWP